MTTQLRPSPVATFGVVIRAVSVNAAHTTKPNAVPSVTIERNAVGTPFGNVVAAATLVGSVGAVDTLFGVKSVGCTAALLHPVGVIL